MHESQSGNRKIHIGWITLAVCAALFALFLFQLLGPSPGIVVSKQTTYINEPLRADGLPDYEAYWVQQSSQGVTPENNAAPLIWQALWPGDLEEKYWLPLCEALGMETVPSADGGLVEPYDESVSRNVARDLAKHYSETDGENEDRDYLSEEWIARLNPTPAHDAIEWTSSRPWTSDRLPAMADWVEQSQQPLDLLVEASKRPRYFSPSPSMLDNEPHMLIEMLLPDIQMMRMAARTLPVRAMWHLGEDRPMQAWEDLLACHRLARLTGHNNTLVGQLVAIAIDGIACQSTNTLLHHGELSAEQLRQILADLRGLGPTSDCARAIEEGERLSFLDIVLYVATGSRDPAEILGDNFEPLQAMSMARVNWNSVLQTGNEWYDKIVQAASIPEREARLVALEQVESDLHGIMSASRTPSALIGGLFTQSRRSELVGNMLLSMMIPATSAAFSAEDRNQVQFELTRLAAALAVYRAEQGQYPEKLDALVPSVLPQVPLDIYSGQPFIYRRRDDGGYLLYSVFENGTDDGGDGVGGEVKDGEWVDERPEDYDYQESDVVIRVPVPKFELPPPPSAEDLEYGFGGR